MAWERTAVSLGAAGLVLVKVVDGGRATQAAGLVLVAMASSVVLVMVPLGYVRSRDRVDPGVPEQPFAHQDRWRPRVLMATSYAISVVTIVVAMDIWLTGAI